jgi:single-stranded-DNA-specific exonuclease
VIARVIRNRERISEEEIEQYLHGGMNQIYSFQLMKGMEKALELLLEKIGEKKKIRIIGDYDIDGVCSTYILLIGLKKAGAIVDIDIPDRIKDGYGISKELIDLAYQAGTDTIITCDNGISAIEQVAYAKSLGMTVIVTDHHEIPYEEQEDGSIKTILPPADAIVNPKQEGCRYPFKGICGAMVAYKLICGLYEKKGFPKEAQEEFIEFAAIATVGDVMDLQDENRIVVKEGLRRMKNTKNYGLRALIRVNHLEEAELTGYHIGFVLGPCINASGRLSTAKKALNLLLCKDEKKAQELAEELKALNDSRKEMTQKGVEQAEKLVETTELKEDRVLVIYLPDCHESLAGIIAGRIRETYNKPVIVLTKGKDGVKGSGRSIETYHMFKELVKCKDLLSKFGGHPMAAGLSIEEKNIEEFRRRLNVNCTLTDEELRPKIVIDVPMPVSYITKELVEQISLLEPFGKGNTKPVFAQKNLRVLDHSIIGKNKNVVKLKLLDPQGISVEGIYFGEAEDFVNFIREKDSISVTYYPEINRYQGRETLQIVIRNYLTE